jgi:hypothetical protein
LTALDHPLRSHFKELIGPPLLQILVMRLRETPFKLCAKLHTTQERVKEKSERKCFRYMHWCRESTPP